ncbi:MAG: sigma-70 family RNA polymerase sigma factor [Verrucomicrobia bacterium]|nr:sigma-70 family RNA polymerase sigma factor [Verrucomicrobiota bacterium]
MPNDPPPGAETDDLELVRRAQSGETKAFDELVTKYRSRVYAMIYQMVRNEQDAWDLAQDGFFKAWKSLDKFRFQSSFYTWLYRIVTNVSIDWLRKKQVRAEGEFDESQVHPDIEPTADITPKGDVSPERQLERGELRERLDAAIARLSPEHRQVILLKEIDGLQYHEIADVVGCSIGTVMSRLFYARKKLQTMLRDLHERA